ncbi:MAG TPA: sulfatase, partial [Candidatus Hydrogenedentes bacterium]|nr:sulfatase [Candidatus Hydrogenedentota bacterium]
MIAYAPEAWQEYAGITPGTRVDRLVSCLELAPTTLALAGAPIPETMQGRPFLGGALDPEPEYVYATRDRMDERCDTIRMVRDKRYKYIRNYQPFQPYSQYLSYNEQSPVQQDLNRLREEGALPPGAHWMSATRKPVEELYDTEQDPHEINNIAALPESSPILERMREALEARMEAIGDLGLLPESELDRLGKQYGCRYYIRKRHEAAHPGFWRRLHETAALAGQPQSADEPALLQALDSEHPAIRWWAVTGLAQLSASETTMSALRRAMQDDAAVVAVAAARALLQQEDANDDALAILVNGLNVQDEW